MKFLILLLALSASTKAFSASCDYFGYSYNGDFLTDCHHVRAGSKRPVKVGCNLSLKDGMRAVVQGLRDLEAKGECQLEAAHCTVGAANKGEGSAAAAIWINPDFKKQGRSFHGSVYQYSYEAGGNWYTATRTPSGTSFCGSPKCPTEQGITALTEARETLEFLVQEGVCKPQSLPITCSKYEYDDNYFVVSDIWDGLLMAGHFSLYEGAGICKK